MTHPTSASPLGGGTRERILQAARELFAIHGFEGASTRAIGRSAAANIAMIAYHFGDKHGLYEAVLSGAYTALLDFNPPDRPEGDQNQRLRALIGEAFDFGCAHHDDVRVLMRHIIEAGSLPESVRLHGTAALLQRLDHVRKLYSLPSLEGRTLELLSLNHLLTRYILSDLDDVAAIMGAAEPRTMIREHLGDLAVRLLSREVSVEKE